MKIIDAHLHFGKEPYFDAIAKAALHENNERHLKKEYERLGITCGIVMGNKPLEDVDCEYPAPLFYCVGLSGMAVDMRDEAKKVSLVERHLQKENCVGIKLYPGYNYFYIYEDFMAPIYRLAAKYQKPVAVHTGLTAGSNAYIKYSHPLVMDEAAAKFPDVSFVMCHFGEPWFTDAVAVMEKNPNVSADLSGMLEGKIPDFDAFCRQKKFYIEQLAGLIEYLDAYDRLMFGTDWPLANLTDYIKFTEKIIPPSEREKIFFTNAKNIYRLKIKN